MTFIINTIKEGFNKKYNVEFVLWVDSPLLAKKIMEEFGIIVLSMKEYKEPEKDLKNITLTFPYLQQEIKVTTQYDWTLSEACKFFLMLWFPITYINSTTTPVTEEEVNKIVENWILENKKEQEAQQEAIEEKEVAAKKIYDDPKLKIDKEIIDRIFKKIEEIVPISEGIISWKELKELREKEDELKKLKLWTNHERIKELVQEIINTLEKTQTIYCQNHKDEQIKLIPESVTTNFDLNKWLDTRDKVVRLKELWGKIKPNEQDYLTLGKYALYPKLLFKDIKYRFSSASHITEMVYNAYDLREMAIAFILIQSSFWMVANILFLRSDSLVYDYFYWLFISLWLIWLLSRWARYLRKKNLAILIGLIPAIIIAYYILMAIINNNFSL